MANLDSKTKEYLSFFDKSLEEFFNKYLIDIPEVLADSIKYSVFNGGKRVRPILCYATAEMLGLNIDSVKEFSLAIEFIHSYSLVHDDLPAMDNDDFRRGKLSTHKKFGEANGILAGDSLLNLAFEVVLSKENLTSLDIKALKLLAEYSGCKGMILGQSLDLASELNLLEVCEQNLNRIFINKTSRLLTAPILIASILSGGKYFNELLEFGTKLGILFQITDDLLDLNGTLESIGKTPNKDEKANKMTSIKIYGEKGANDKAQELYNDCIKILSNIPKSDFLLEFTKKIFNRKK